MAVADGKVFSMAVAAITLRLNMLERGVWQPHMRAAHPTWHLAVQLAGDGFVHFVADVAQAAHSKDGLVRSADEKLVFWRFFGVLLAFFSRYLVASLRRHWQF